MTEMKGDFKKKKNKKANAFWCWEKKKKLRPFGVWRMGEKGVVPLGAWVGSLVMRL